MLDWDDETSWEPLVWDLAVQTRCPIHLCELEYRCHICGSTQKTNRRRITLCGYCAQPLGWEGRSGHRSHHEIWAEQEVYELLSLCADPYQGRIPFSHYVTFVNAVEGQIAADTSLGAADREIIRQILGVSRRASDRSLPSKLTLQRFLNVCGLQGVRIRDVLLRPDEAGSRPLLYAWRGYEPLRLQGGAWDVKVKTVRKLAELMLVGHKRVYVPRIETLLRAVGVTPTTLHDYAPDLYARYVMLHRRQARYESITHAERAFRNAVWWLQSNDYKSHAKSDVEGLIRHIAVSSDVSPATARRTVLGAVRWRRIAEIIRANVT